ncbi:MAG TPA: zinc-dependent metalloprotease, partial [Bacteroidota bacterium]|nr:zinc-dependent metalloprotease [Bacteroidota bacterium]
MITKNVALVIVAALLLAGCGASKPSDVGAAGPPKPPEKKESPKPYAEVITKEAKSDTGMFIAHRIKQKLYYEIPSREFGKEYLLVTSQAKTQPGVGYGGDNLNYQVVRWDRSGERVILRSILYASVAPDSLPVYYAVEKANYAPILMVFDVQAFNKDSSTVVIDATDLYVSDMTEMGMDRRTREQLKIRRVDPKRTFIESVRSFPDNIETRVTVTYDAGQVPLHNALSTISMLLHHSMVRLPEKPMIPRLYDERVSFFAEQVYDYGYDGHRAERRRFISRWRLEPKDTAAFLRGELVEPVKPIVFYVDRGVPDKWRPYLKKGIESWQKAFEKAGFRNAILAKDPPAVKEDPDWSSEDARYATIRWLPSEIQNAYGPHIADPRSGEILDADLGLYHNVMSLARNWYVVQAGAVDSCAQKLPLPDDLMGELLLYVAAPEVGHSLGFPHNMKATSMYPVDSLRSRTFTQQYGTEASIMDYGRFNYIAQPGDGARLIPIIGPYDLFATEWGYRPFIGASTPDDERARLNAIAARQETEPFLRFGDADGIDPTAQTEDLGADAVAATRYGLQNIARIADFLLPATTKQGEDYSLLRELYGELIGQRNRELGHVANVVGGVTRTRRVAGQEGVVYDPVPREKQKEAMALLTSDAFRTPTEILKPEILTLIEPSGTAERILQGQRS